MKYPVDFVEKVRKVYPGWKELYEKLAKGSEFVGRYLDDSRYFSMSPAEIIEAFEQGREQDVLKAAKEADERTKLYAEWGTLYRAQH